MKEIRAYIAATAIILAGSLGALAVFNFVVDPYRAYRLVSSPAFDRYKNTGMARRTKAEDVRRGGWEAVLIGSSRVEVGLDPRHPALHGLRTYNLGLSETTLPEVAAALHYALASNELSLVVLLVDPELFSTDHVFGSELARSPFNPRYGAVEYHASNLVGLRATEDSIAALLDYRADQPAYHDALGRMSVAMTPPDVAQAELVARSLRWRTGHKAFRYRSELTGVFEPMVAECLDAGVRLVIATPPLHALLLELLRRQGAWPEIERWKRDLVRIAAHQSLRHPAARPIEAWDFAGFWSYNTEAVPSPAERASEMRWHWEAIHFKKELGDVLLARVLEENGADPAFGVRLDTVDLERHLADQRKEAERWGRARPGDVELLDRIEPPA